MGSGRAVWGAIDRAAWLLMSRSIRRLNPGAGGAVTRFSVNGFEPVDGLYIDPQTGARETAIRSYCGARCGRENFKRGVSIKQRLAMATDFGLVLIP